MQILENISLKSLNTFGIDVIARYLSKVSSEDEIRECIDYFKTKNFPMLVLGGGSNMLFTKNWDGFVLKNEILGIEKISEDEKTVTIKVGAGENWHQFVMHCVANNLAGAENLSLIPGNTGAGPMQNIGAYGVELKDIFYSLDALEIETGRIKTFHLNDCEFDYRSSIFKTRAKGQFIICSVNFILQKNPVFNTSYGAIEQELEKEGITELSVKAISDAVIRIRQSKLPDPKQIGNAGSFFKNPSIGVEQYEKLKSNYPDIPGYPSTENGKIKTAAGWLIEKAGWKGKTFGNYGVHKNQALVLVNYGSASGIEIYQLSENLIADVFEKFGIELEREVNIV